jgi:hypothetical protein
MRDVERQCERRFTDPIIALKLACRPRRRLRQLGNARSAKSVAESILLEVVLPHV